MKRHDVQLTFELVDLHVLLVAARLGFEMRTPPTHALQPNGRCGIEGRCWGDGRGCAVPVLLFDSAYCAVLCCVVLFRCTVLRSDGVVPVLPQGAHS